MHIYFYAYKGFLNSKEQSKYKKTPSPRYMRISNPVVIKSVPQISQKDDDELLSHPRCAGDFSFDPEKIKCFTYINNLMFQHCIAPLIQVVLTLFDLDHNEHLIT